MRRRTGAIGTLIALAATVPLAEPAHAQDLDCGDFSYQEDAQAFFDTDRSDPHRLDEDAGPDDGIACEALPRRGDGLTSSTSRPRPETPTTPQRPTSTPAEAPTAMSPAASAPAVAPAASAPPTPVPTRTPGPSPATATASATATRGVRGGVGGSSTAGPSDWDLGIGAAFVTGAAAGAFYVVRRRRS